MRMDRHEHLEWTDLLSDYMEGTLGPDDHRALEEHLGACGPCRLVLEEMREIVERAGSLAPLEPPRDLWAGIAAVIGAPGPSSAAAGTRVIAFPGSDDVPSNDRGSGRPLVTLSGAQLVAASVALIAASSLATWVAGPTFGVRWEQAPAGSTPRGGVSMAETSFEPPAELADELAAFEATLAQARHVLDPNTVRVLERNLRVIEHAIEDSRRALAMDPENEFLADHLDRVYRRKLAYLRDAARVAEWSG